MPLKILIVLSPFSNSKTALPHNALYMKALSCFYQQMNGARFQCDFVSLNGASAQNVPPKLPVMRKWASQTLGDPAFLNRLKYSLHPQDVHASEYQAIFFCGGFPVLSALEQHLGLQKITTQIYESGGYVVTLAHGIAGLLDVRLSDNSYLLADKRLTASSREEDKLLGLSQKADFSVEAKLREQGADFEKATLPFAPHVIRDHQLITGQNYLSASLLCKYLTEALLDTTLELTSRVKEFAANKEENSHQAIHTSSDTSTLPQAIKVALN